jgi:uncharacterized membrane protein
VRKSLFARWRASFFTGLVIVLPGVITLAAVKWFFGTVSSLTDLLLFFLPYFLDSKSIYVNGEAGTMFWYWSLLALIFAALTVTVIGVLARYYIGKRLIAWADSLMLRVPVLNKIYGTIKQVDAAFAGNKNSFKTVVLIEYPRPGIYSVGFITSEQEDEISKRLNQKNVCVYIPTTPIPTSGFLVITPLEQVTKLDMSVADGFKYIISLGAISNEAAPPGSAEKTRMEN